MLEQPNGEDLILQARQTLLKELLPLLPEVGIYPALMIANAMAISGRQLHSALPQVKPDLEIYARLYSADVVQQVAEDDSQRQTAMMAKLASDIRAGEFDGILSGRLQSLLIDQVKNRLDTSNPKYLKTWQS